MRNKRTIESILDLETGREVFASDFLNKPIDEIFKQRYEFESGIREKKSRFVCYYCKQAIKLRGQANSKKILHFAHLRDSNECPIKTNNNYTKEEILRIKYNGAKESALHYDLKTFIGNILNENRLDSKGVEFVEIEIVNKHKAISKEWKRPDVTSIYKGKTIVFELQLSTTFLSVINSRQEFYRENKTFILWVFNSFETNEEYRKFTQSDVFYNNNRNGFELNQEAREISQKQNDLILKCYYEKPIIKNQELFYEWKSEFVSLSDLTFDENTYKVYFYDVEGNSEKIKLELELKKSELIKLIESCEATDIYNLFVNGYKCSEVEKKHIISLYNKYVKNERIIKYQSIGYNIIVTTICIKLGDKDLINTLINSHPHERTVIDILCLKLDKIIGYNITNQMQVSHFFVGHSPEHLDLYLKAIQKYQPNYIEKYDTSGKFRKKIMRIKQSGQKQFFDTRIVFKIFPELNDK